VGIDPFALSKLLEERVVKIARAGSFYYAGRHNLIVVGGIAKNRQVSSG
jgi:hypothetical protein